MSGVGEGERGNVLGKRRMGKGEREWGERKIKVGIWGKGEWEQGKMGGTKGDERGNIILIVVLTPFSSNRKTLGIKTISRQARRASVTRTGCRTEKHIETTTETMKQ